MYQTIKYEVHDDHVATVTINRPDIMNTFNSQMVEEMAAVWEQIKLDDSVHAVVVRAADSRAFSTGKDVTEKDSIWREGVVWSQWDPGKKIGPKQNEMWKPVICAVHGLCCGGAYYWLNESDIVICSEDAEFFDPHVSFGMVSACEPIGLTRRIAYGEVMRMNLLGNDERMSSSTALRIGLVSEVLNSRAELWARARELAAKVATLDNTRQTLQDKIDELNNHTYVLQEKITSLKLQGTTKYVERTTQLNFQKHQMPLCQ